jgi:hypothetical protein
MRTNVEFRSAKFPPYAPEVEEVNPGCWGRRLAEYLKERLAALGIDTADIVSEDCTWVIPIRSSDPFSLSIGCGHQYGDDDVFLCFISPDRPVIRKRFQKFETTQAVSRLASALDEILSSDPEITKLKWMNEKDQFGVHI